MARQAAVATFGFHTQRRVGDTAVDWLRRRLEALPDSRGVLSVEGERDYQQLGVDLLWVRGSANGREYVTRVEAKGDTHKAINLYLETISSVETNQPGCILTTNADYLAYIFINEHVGYMFQVPALRAWLLRTAQYQDTAGWKTVRTRSNRGAYTSRGVTVPVSEALVDVAHEVLY